MQIQKLIKLNYNIQIQKKERKETMLKKILTLSLVAVMLSTAVLATEFMELTSVHAAEAGETFTDEVIVASSTDNPMEFLWATRTEDAEGAKITSVSWTATSQDMTKEKWMLAKIRVGENREFSAIKFQTRWQMYKIPGTASTAKGTSYVYCAPLSYSDYAAAAAIKGTSDTLSTLVKPSPSDANVKKGSLSKQTDGTTQNISVTLDAATFNNSDYYHDGCIYLAFYEGDVENDSYNDNIALKNAHSYWKITMSGTIVEPAVTDFSDAVITWENGEYTVTTATASGTAMLIAASFNGTEMVDAKVATIDAATAENGVITGNITDLKAGTSVKVFLWNPTTLAPAIGVSNF